MSVNSEDNKRTSNSGFAKIKQEYLLADHAREVNLNFVASSDKKRLLNDQNTKDQSDDIPRKKLKGQNKHRPREARTPKSEKLCLKIISEENCPYGDHCCFSHDVKNFVEKKPKDIDEKCHIFETYGKCPFSFMCRFASKHVDAQFKNIINLQLWNKNKDKVFSFNNLSKELQMQLRKRTYNFEKSDKILKIIQSGKHKTKMPIKIENSPDKALKDVFPEECKYVADLSSCDSLKNVQNEPAKSELPYASSIEKGENACVMFAEPKLQSTLEPELCDDNGTKPVISDFSNAATFRSRLLERKKVDFADKLYLAPLTTVGNLPFRRICKTFGADITCGEMAMCVNLLQGQQSEWALLKRHASEDVFGVQLCGAHPDVMTRCAQLLSENIKIDFVDINMGCPIDIVYQKGAGCGLMNRLKKLEDIVFGMTSVLDVPLTVKLRTGIYENKNIAHSVINKMKEWDGRISAIALHGRSREQRYTKLANWDYIEQCAKLADPIPFYGCGDILSFEDANARRQETGISGIMIARGALIKPWIFTEIKEQRHWDISSSERFDIIKKYVNYGLEHWGSDTEGVEKTRRFLLEWLSFLYRYIPVGLLEHVPQKINERPPPYFGRDDLETLMASPSCADWIKISEMLLGPVSENFVFLPKHKAHAYQ